MRIHYIQHVPFEGLANIGNWALTNNYLISRTRTYENEEYPEISEFDLLVIMGGPMNVYDEDKYPWLKDEKSFIKKAIDNKKIVIGICLGAQLIADILGAKVYKNEHTEIGWFPVEITGEALKNPLLNGMANEITAFHWHGDTFDIPQNCTQLASSAGCANQGFIYDDRVIALQFHLETTQPSAEELIKNCAADIKNNQYIQSADEILSGNDKFKDLQNNLITLLDNVNRTI